MGGFYEKPENMYVSKIIQKVCIDISEEGGTAAAPVPSGKG